MQLFAPGAGIKPLPRDSSLGFGVRVLFVRLQDLFQPFDIPIDDVEQDLPALGFILERRQFGITFGRLLAKHRELNDVEIAVQFTEWLRRPWLELGAGIENRGAGFIEPRVNWLMPQQANGLKPIGSLPESPRRKPRAQPVPGVEQKPRPQLRCFQFLENVPRLIRLDWLPAEGSLDLEFKVGLETIGLHGSAAIEKEATSQREDFLILLFVGFLDRAAKCFRVRALDAFEFRCVRGASRDEEFLHIIPGIQAGHPLAPALLVRVRNVLDERHSPGSSAMTQCIHG